MRNSWFFFPLSFLFSILVTSCILKLPKSTVSDPSNAYLDALQGGIFGRSGIEISERDRRKALVAEYNTLETTPSGKSVLWSGNGISGQVIASAPYQVGSENCRQYIHKVVFSDKQVDIRGVACRNYNGSWTPLF